MSCIRSRVRCVRPLVIAGLCAILWCARAEAQPILALRFDTSHLGSPRDAALQKAVLDAMLARLSLEQLLQDPVAEGVLRECLAQAAATGARASLDVASAAQAHAGEALRYRALLAIRSAGTMDAYASILERCTANAPSSKVAVAGESVAEHRDPSWPAWRSLDVLSQKGVLVIGLGEGRAAIEHALATPPTDAPLDRHRDALGHRAGTPVLECYIDLNLARVSFPDSFGDDPAGRFLAACHLANARSCMLHVRSSGAPGTLAIDATWSLRSEPDDRIRRVSIASFAPDAERQRDPLAILRPEMTRWALASLDAYASLLGPEVRRSFDRQRRAWAARRLPLLARLEASLGAEAMLALDQSASGLTLGAWRLRWPLRQGVKPGDVSRAVRALLDPWEKDIAPNDDGLSGRLVLPPGSLVRALEWSVEPDALIVRIDTTPDGAWLITPPK